MNISDTDNSLNLNLAKELSEFFRINEHRADEIIKEVVFAVRKWKSVATKYGISRQDQELKALAFQAAEAYTI